MEHVANFHQLLSMAKKLRTEKEKQRQMQQLKDEQKNLLIQLEGRRQRLHQQLLQVRKFVVKFRLSVLFFFFGHKQIDFRSAG